VNPSDRPSVNCFMSSGSDLEDFWPGRRLDAFDGLCPRVASSRALEAAG
jgi:hypothetical protein